MKARRKPSVVLSARAFLLADSQASSARSFLLADNTQAAKLVADKPRSSKLRRNKRSAKSTNKTDASAASSTVSPSTEEESKQSEASASEAVESTSVVLTQVAAVTQPNVNTATKSRLSLDEIEDDQAAGQKRAPTHTEKRKVRKVTTKLVQRKMVNQKQDETNAQLGTIPSAMTAPPSLADEALAVMAPQSMAKEETTLGIRAMPTDTTAAAGLIAEPLEKTAEACSQSTAPPPKDAEKLHRQFINGLDDSSVDSSHDTVSFTGHNEALAEKVPSADSRERLSRIRNKLRARLNHKISADELEADDEANQRKADMHVERKVIKEMRGDRRHGKKQQEARPGPSNWSWMFNWL